MPKLATFDSFNVHRIVFNNFLQLVFGASDDRVLVSGADTTEVVQGQIVDKNTTQTFRLGVGSLIASCVRILITDPDSVISSVLIVRLEGIAAIFLGWITNTSQTTYSGFCQPGAHLSVREKSWRVCVWSFGSRTLGDYRWYPWYLTVRRELPCPGVCWDSHDYFRAWSTVFEPVPWNRINTLRIF